MADDFDRAMAHLQAGVAANGVASVKVRDGEVFMFSRQMINDLLARMTASGQDQVVVFVKTGGILSKETMQ